ncbi:MAG: response regulator transcription factor [Chitinophaga sp.]|nr:response regulator transcription factor [Chitinophaga sp.]
MKYALEKDGNYEVIVAENGMEAWDYFNNRSFDACLLDVHMPKLDGVELGAKIRTVDAVIPILFISGDVHLETQLKGFQIGGADDYCTKPIDISLLTFQMEALIRRAKGQQDACETIVLDTYIFNPHLATLTFDGMSVSLSANEVRVLKCLVSNNNKTVDNDSLRQLVSGTDKQRALYATIAMLRTHFKYSSIVEILTVQRSGYLLSIPKESIRYF